jgi:hypothetical protein
VIYANTSKSNKRSEISNQIEDKIVFANDLAYLDHSLPPLGLFLQIKFHKWLADLFVALALISPPLALSTKTGSFLAL